MERMQAQGEVVTVGGRLRDRSWKLIRGRHKCQASRESPGDSILPGSTVRASAAAMASLDVAVANCEGVILPERSASSWSASCGHMHTLYLQNNSDAHILHGPSTGLATQSGRQGHRQLQELLFREAARRRLQFLYVVSISDWGPNSSSMA